MKSHLLFLYLKIKGNKIEIQGYILCKIPWWGGGWVNGRVKSQGKNEKEERKTEENYIKNGGKDLKNASFWAINSKNFRGKPPQTCSSGKKMNHKRRGGGGGKMIEMNKIYPCTEVKCTFNVKQTQAIGIYKTQRFIYLPNKEKLVLCPNCLELLISLKGFPSKFFKCSHK